MQHNLHLSSADLCDPVEPFAHVPPAYNRDALLFMRNSPHSKTPPVGMHAIAGVTIGVAGKPESNGKPKPTPTPSAGGDDVFEMDT